MSEEVPRPLPKEIGEANLKKFPQLPEKDQNLYVTPEKSSLRTGKNVMEQRKESSMLPCGILIDSTNLNDVSASSKPCNPNADLIPTKLAAVIGDPTLDVTPEKLPTALKKTGLVNEMKPSEKSSKSLHVRFDVPAANTESDNSLPEKLSSDSSDQTGSKEEKKSDEPFQKRAALYAQRNPLADLTSDSSQPDTSESISYQSETFMSSECDSSVPTDGSQDKTEELRKAKEMVPDSQILPTVKLKTVEKPSVSCLHKAKPEKRSVMKKDRIVNVSSDDKATNMVIDKITKPHPNEREKSKEKTSETNEYLKKKSGLQKHQHTVRYCPSGGEKTSSFSEATYNSTKAFGQKLQELKISEFDAKSEMMKKIDNSQRLQTYLAEKTAEATNIHPEENLYQNLVSVTVPAENLIQNKSNKWRRLKPKQNKSKVPGDPKPDIWDYYDPEELYSSEPDYGDYDWLIKPKNGLGLRIRPPSPKATLSPLDAAEKLYRREQLWNGAWGRRLPKEEDRVDNF